MYKWNKLHIYYILYINYILLPIPLPIVNHPSKEVNMVKCKLNIVYPYNYYAKNFVILKSKRIIKDKITAKHCYMTNCIFHVYLHFKFEYLNWQSYVNLKGSCLNLHLMLNFHLLKQIIQTTYNICEKSYQVRNGEAIFTEGNGYVTIQKCSKILHYFYTWTWNTSG